MKKAYYALLLATATFAQVNASITDYFTVRNAGRVAEEAPNIYVNVETAYNMWLKWKDQNPVAYTSYDSFPAYLFNAPQALRENLNTPLWRDFFFIVANTMLPLLEQNYIEKGWKAFYYSEWNIIYHKGTSKLPDWAQVIAYQSPRVVFDISAALVTQNFLAKLRNWGYAPTAPTIPKN